MVAHPGLPGPMPPDPDAPQIGLTLRQEAQERRIAANLKPFVVLLYLVHARRNLFPRNYLRFLQFLASPNRADIETTT